MTTDITEATVQLLKARGRRQDAAEDLANVVAWLEGARGETGLDPSPANEAELASAKKVHDECIEALATAEAAAREATRRFNAAAKAAEDERLAGVRAEGLAHTKVGLALARRTIAALRQAGQVTGPLSSEWDRWDADARHLRNQDGGVARFSTPRSLGRSWVDFESGLRAVTAEFVNDVENVSRIYGLTDDSEKEQDDGNPDDG